MSIFFARVPMLTTLRGLLTIAAIHGNPLAFGDCHSACHQSPFPSESEPVYWEPVPEAQVDSSKFWLCKKAPQGLKISPQAWYSQQTEGHRHVLRPADILSFDVREETQTTVRWFDPLASQGDVAGTGPDEHLMKDSDHMKTTVYLTDVLVLRNEGDTVKFWGLEITKTSRVLRGENSTELVLIPCESLWSGKVIRHSTVMELATAIPLDGHDYFNFRTVASFSSSETDMKFRT